MRAARRAGSRPPLSPPVAGGVDGAHTVEVVAPVIVPAWSPVPQAVARPVCLYATTSIDRLGALAPSPDECVYVSSRSAWTMVPPSGWGLQKPNNRRAPRPA